MTEFNRFTMTIRISLQLKIPESQSYFTRREAFEETERIPDKIELHYIKTHKWPGCLP